MTDTPPDWVLIKAQKLCGWTAIGSPEQLRLRYKTAGQYSSGSSFAALCDMIAKYETEPVDPLVEVFVRLTPHVPTPRDENETYAAAMAREFAVELAAHGGRIVWEQGYGA